MTSIIRYIPPRQAAPTIIYYAGGGSAPKARSRLDGGQFLAPGTSLTSPNGAYQFKLQTDGNLVLLSRGAPIYSPQVEGQGGTRLTMQLDGNLVLTKQDGTVVWHVSTEGHPEAFVQMQDDGNAVVYSGANVPLWWTDTAGGVLHVDEGSWLSQVVTAAGRPFADLGRKIGEAVSVDSGNLAEGARQVTKAASYIPIVGPALHGVLLIASGPFTFTDAVIDGERIDRALVNDLRDKITGIREVAPYAQTVISFIPGIGQGVSAAIGAGLALAQGMPIDKALLEGIKGALPGGAAARAAFDLTVAAASGDNLVVAAGNAAIGTLGIPIEAQQGLGKALSVVYRASKGENVPAAALDEARSYLPDGPAQKAFDVGLALAHGKRLQDTLVDGVKSLGPEGLDALRTAGQGVLRDSPALQAGQNVLRKIDLSGMASQSKWLEKPVRTASDGYELGVGLMHHAGVNEDVVKAVREKLTPNEQQGFDMGIAAYRAAVLAPTPPVDMPSDPATHAGYLLTQGMQGRTMPPVARTFFLVPQVQAGKTYAIAQQRSSTGFFAWLKRLVFR